jgi:hypothetical protein
MKFQKFMNEHYELAISGVKRQQRQGEREEEAQDPAGDAHGASVPGHSGRVRVDLRPDALVLLAVWSARRRRYYRRLHVPAVARYCQVSTENTLAPYPRRGSRYPRSFSQMFTDVTG